MGKGRTYTAVNTDRLLEDVLKRIITGKKNYKSKITNFFKRARCFFLGHQMVSDYWKRDDNPNWFEQKDFEYHIGCRKCPEFRIEKP